MRIYNYPPCPNCYKRNPTEMSDIEIWKDISVKRILRCQDCGFIYKVGDNGEPIDSPHKLVYSKRIKKLSEKNKLVDVFRTVEENKGINIVDLSKSLGTTNTSLVGKYVLELEKNRILEVKYIDGQRILSIAESKGADLFKELVQE